MTEPVRVVHYVNQFFAGVGGEDHGDAPVGRREGAVGPGTLLQELLGPDARIVSTVWCGDNRFHEATDASIAELISLIASDRPSVVVTGPAFNAGRYGIACAMLGAAIVEQLSRPVVSGMFPENPGVDQGRASTYIVPTKATAAGMRDALGPIARLARLLGRGETLGPADVEGYLARGARKNYLDTRTGAERMVDMLVARLRGAPFRTELDLPSFDRVPPAPPVRDLSRVRLALVTEAGVVPQGNPDRLESWRATKWVKYPIADMQELSADRFTSVHGGFDVTQIRKDPNRIVPLDVVREMERAGLIGHVHEDMYVTMGNVAPVARAKQFGREMAEDLKKEGVEAVLLSAT